MNKSLLTFAFNLALIFGIFALKTPFPGVFNFIVYFLMGWSIASFGRFVVNQLIPEAK